MKQLKLATYNIHLGGTDAGYEGYDFSALAEDILHTGADLIGMQEVDRNTRRNGGRDTMRILSELTGLPYHYFVCANPSNSGEYGVALLSKYPLSDMHFFNLPKTDEREENRVVLCATAATDAGSIQCFVTHNQQISIRRQLAFIGELAAKCEKYILFGDFNWDRLADFHEYFPNALLANDSGRKLASSLDGYAFDNIIVPRAAFEMRYPSVIATGNSDHYLLTAEVYCKEGAESE